MLPLKDLNPTRRTPVITYGLIAANVLVFLWEQSFSAGELQEQLLNLSIVPAQVVENPFSLETFLDFVRSMFFHGGWAHLLGNMLYLWLFGDNIEDRMGRLLYPFFYLAGGFAAALAQVAIDPSSTIPLIGASGAIAGILGGYLIMFPGVKVRGIIPLGWFARWAEWPAWAVLGLWFVLQLFNGAISLGVQTGAMGGVAFFAHIGGFLAGIAMTWAFMRLLPQPPAEQRRDLLYERARRYRF
jgi:membrane associated rhomboid family serine protease